MVEEHEADAALVQQPQRNCSVGRRDRVDAHLPQDGDDERSGGRVVVDDQHG